MSNATSFLLGIAAGSAVAVLLAPCSGVDTRRRLKRGLNDGKAKMSAGADFVKRKSEEVAQDLVKKGETLVDAGKQRVADEAQRINSALQAGKEAYRGSTAQA
jgi:gas vesicle protein